MKFTQSEIELIPDASIHKVFLPQFYSERIEIKVKGKRKPVILKRYEGQDNVVVTDKRTEKEFTLTVSEIEEIKHINRAKRTGTSGTGITPGEIAEAAPYLIYLPLLVIVPFYYEPEEVSKTEIEEHRKAKVVYKGLSQEDLLESVGKPDKRYLCELLSDPSRKSLEIWRYQIRKVLPGGEFLIIDRFSREVLYPAHEITDLDNCSLIPNP